MKVTYKIAECEVPQAVWNAHTKAGQRITKLKTALRALIDEIDDRSQPEHWESYEKCKDALK